MLSIGKLGPGQVEYYLEHADEPVTAVVGVSTGVEDYYVKGGEPPGRWCGRGAAAIELSGGVAPNGLRAVLAGRHPDGTQLRVRGSVPGYDVTLSAPKSVSVLFAVGPEPVRHAALDAHEVAVRAALAYLDEAAAVTRRGAGGVTVVRGDGLIGAAFLHRSSRAGDPQIHTHVLIANMTRGPDGRWTALDARALYAHGRTAGYLYQATLRAELTRRLGVEWGPVRKGQAELEGITERVLRAFSRRRVEIEAALRQRGTRGASAARVATFATRRVKDYGVTAEGLRADWQHRASVLGLSERRLATVLGRRAQRVLSADEWDLLFDHFAGPDGLTSQTSTFTRGDLIRALCEVVPAGTDADAIVAQADAFLATRAICLVERDPRTHDARYSTPEMLTVERRVLTTALQTRQAGRGLADRRATEAAIRAAPRLSDEQATMVRTLTGDGNGVSVVIGEAGTGKTTALAVARQAWEDSGFRVQGCAVARRAATQLGRDAGMPATSIAALLRRGELEPRTVLVVDEAGMVGTRTLDALLATVERAGGKLVLTGDPSQLPAIDAGGGMRSLAARLGHVELTHNRRQRAEWEREALRFLREGDASRALDLYDDHGRVSLCEREEEALRLVIGDWHAAGEPIEAVLIAHRRRDVTELNARARAVIAESGRLGSRTLVTKAGDFAAGDVVLVRTNAARLDVSNGDRGVVHAVDGDGLYVRFQDAYRFLPREFVETTTRRGDPSVQHGYAITAYVAQGMTCRAAFVFARDDLYREWAYTAMSRGREANRLYVVAESDGLRAEIAPGEPVRDARRGLMGALGRSRPEAMAIELAQRRKQTSDRDITRS